MATLAKDSIERMKVPLKNSKAGQKLKQLRNELPEESNDTEVDGDPNIGTILKERGKDQLRLLARTAYELKDAVSQLRK